MSENDRIKSQTSECAFMKLPKCQLQDVSKRLDLEICNACISGRSERHLFDIKEMLEDMYKRVMSGDNSNGRF